MKPSIHRNVIRGLLIVFGVPAGVLMLIVTLGFISMLLQPIGIHLSISDVLTSTFVLLPVIVVGLFMRWAGSIKTGNLILKTGSGAFIAFLLAATVFSTANTNHLVRSADQIAVPAGYNRVIAENAVNDDDLVPETLLPCIDFQADGCPSMNRTWEGEKNQLLSRQDLEKLIKDNNMEDQLTIKEENCLEDDKNPPEDRSCWAHGTIAGYESYIAMQNSYGEPSITLSMRAPRN